MLELLPILPASAELRKYDYLIFASQFKNILRQKIPTAHNVSILSREAFIHDTSGVKNKEKALLFDTVCSDSIPQRAGDGALLFPLPHSDNGGLVALITGVDQFVVKGASDDWLMDIAAYAREEFGLIKQYGTDPITSFYNYHVLSEVLNGAGGEENLHVVLVELLPRARSPKDVFAHVKRSARALQEYIRESFPLFHLGQSVFAHVIREKQGDFLKTYSLSLLTFLKRKGFRRVHCGSSTISIERLQGRVQGDMSSVVLGEAWSALHAACKRGPFAFCDYDLLANPERFPLRTLSKSTITKLQRRWKNSTSHSLVFLKPDFLDMDRFENIAAAYFETESLVIDASGYLLIREGISDLNSKRWAETIIEKIISDKGAGFSLSAGISAYPFRDYSKTEIIRNCQKALIHAGFFGPGSVVIFDALSLNVSGDIYFGEGDLIGAVKEYRRGLELDNRDTNLLNSLGVTYALMNRAAAAQSSFQRVLELEPGNFMAHYNMGLGEVNASRFITAIHYFKAALEAVDAKDKEEAGALVDLNFQLGVALCTVAEYQECIEVLEKWYKQQIDNRLSGKCCRYLGTSYFHLGIFEKATMWLQRGLAFDEFDAESMSLLGELYLKGGEGDEIALRLCEKSVEIDSDNHLFLLRYAKTLRACGYLREALEHLRYCSRRRKFGPEIWYELAHIFAKQGEQRKSKYYFNKLAKDPNVPFYLSEQAQRYLGEKNEEEHDIGV